MEEIKAADQGKLLVGVALTGSRKSKYILKWALDKFLAEGNVANVTFKLIYVFSKMTIATSGPTPMGSWLPVESEDVQEEVETDCPGRRETDWRKHKKLLPNQKIMRAKKVKADIVELESDDIPMAISSEIARQEIRHLVIGVSTVGMFSMKNLSMSRGTDLSQAISEKVPSFCSVYIIGDGKLQQLRPSDSEQNVINIDETSNLSSTSTDSSSSSSSLTLGRLLKNKPSSPKYGGLANGRNATEYFSSGSQPKQHESKPRNAASKSLKRENVEPRHYALKDTNTNYCNASIQSHNSSSGDSGSWISDRTSPGGSFAGTQSTNFSPIGTPTPSSYLHTPPTSASAGTSAVSYAEIIPTDYYRGTPSISPAGTPPTGSYAGTPPTGSYAGTPLAVSRPVTPPGGSYVGTPAVPYATTRPSVSFRDIPSGSERSGSTNQISEIEQLRIELRHIQNMYELTQNSSSNERLQNLSTERLEVAIKVKEERDKEIASIEKNKTKAAQSAAVGSRGKPDRHRPNKTDSMVAQEEESKNRLKMLFSSPAIQYQKFTWEEIMEATSSLSQEFKVGAGAFGTVYKCKLHHTTVAVKVLHSKDSVTNKQFVQELEILSTIRHPHLLLLLGAVPEESSLIYEYMDHGSLDDILFHKTGKASLPWYERFRICYEVAGALAFLHSTKPRPIIHRDLKPANILLDHNLVSKIGDAGLGTMINVEPTDLSLRTIYKETSPVGTLCYIDPEYQRTGRVSTKSDIYALGVVILQLLTAKSAVGVSYLVEDAIDEGNLREVFDPEGGEWPEKETTELALLGLQCSELRGRDRPDLREKILPTLERLKEVADTARESVTNAQTATPGHFICPILKDVMEDPYVAADGYTYDRSAIEQWLTKNDTSPSTKQPLPHKFIMPNTALLEAITQWKSQKGTR